MVDIYKLFSLECVNSKKNKFFCSLCSFGVFADHKLKRTNFISMTAIGLDFFKTLRLLLENKFCSIYLYIIFSLNFQNDFTSNLEVCYCKSLITTPNSLYDEEK